MMRIVGLAVCFVIFVCLLRPHRLHRLIESFAVTGLIGIKRVEKLKPNLTIKSEF